jgi:type II secretory pathway pseudopilin PulG
MRRTARRAKATQDLLKRRCAPQGFTYIGILFAVAIAAISMCGTEALLSIEARRDKERELLFAGSQIRAAIGSYYENSPGPVKAYPASLQDLLTDTRGIVPQRHLRQLYPDPLTGKVDWVLVRTPGGAIMGVHSSAAARPLKQAGFDDRDERFAGAARYADWQFVYDQGYTRYMPAVFGTP